MLSLLAIVVTALLLGSALLWHAVQSLPRVRPAAVLRALWRSGAALIERLFPRPGGRGLAVAHVSSGGTSSQWRSCQLR